MGRQKVQAKRAHSKLEYWVCIFLFHCFWLLRTVVRSEMGNNRVWWEYTLFFFIRTSNFDAEAERSYIFWRFEAETFLKMFLNLPGIVFQPISADVTRQTIKEHFLLRYGIKLLAHTGLTCSDATCEMSRQPTLAKFGFKKRIDHRGLQQDINLLD